VKLIREKAEIVLGRAAGAAAKPQLLCDGSTTKSSLDARFSDPEEIQAWPSRIFF
jgi:hypothetical protein